VNHPFHTKILAWLGIAAISVQLNAVPLNFLLFRLNQNEIARTLCEHKMPHCNGNCYLMKQLAKSANANAEKRAERFGFQLSGHYLSCESACVPVFTSGNRSNFPSLIDNLLAGFHTTVDQPPRFV
jgi:hypothetical protein